MCTAARDTRRLARLHACRIHHRRARPLQSRICRRSCRAIPTPDAATAGRPAARWAGLAPDSHSRSNRATPPRGRACRSPWWSACAAIRKFASVNNGEAAAEQGDREFLFQHRYLLSDAVNAQRFTAAGLCMPPSGTPSTIWRRPAGLVVQVPAAARSNRRAAEYHRSAGASPHRRAATGSGSPATALARWRLRRPRQEDPIPTRKQRAIACHPGGVRGGGARIAATAQTRACSCA